ncbi:NUDIX hydrolase, partial [Halobacillus sp. BBL2006]|uniref:NUDIX hydrolase n=1 Tax=Halobacillus sp. BBL2006 TaxID=1543706 RepID=UPI0005427CCF
MDVRYEVGKQRFNYRAAGVLMENGHVLFHKQKGDTYWALPGGGIEMGEKSEDSVVREMEEELGYEVDVVQTLWIAENFFEYNGKDYHELGFYHLLKTDQNHFQQEPFYGLEGERLIYQWLPIAQLQNFHLQPTFLSERLKDL